MNVQDIAPYLASRRALLERELDRLTAPAALGTPALAAAVRYSLLDGGKRLRPLLVLAGAEACGAAPRAALPVACAFEMVHAYSLIHDDLPAMDDGDLRRGRPTSHRKFGEALAILAGDALLTRAFGVIADSPLATRRAREAVRLLALAAGGPGMVGGQALEMVDGRGPGSGVRGPQERTPPATLRNPARLLGRIHAMKTAALIAGAAEAGAVVAGAPAALRRALHAYGRELGHGFQITDDILDAAADARRPGGKPLTYPELHGLEAAQREAGRRLRAAHRALAPLGPRARRLRAIADQIVSRER